MALFSCICFFGAGCPDEKQSVNCPRWLEKAHRICPDFVKRWHDEKSETPTDMGVPHEVLLARKGETPPGRVVVDTACNRSMVGELTMKADREDLRKNHGLVIRLVPSQERFSFGAGSHKGKDVAFNAIRPI